MIAVVGLLCAFCLVSICAFSQPSLGNGLRIASAGFLALGAVIFTASGAISATPPIHAGIGMMACLLLAVILSSAHLIAVLTVGRR